MPQHFHRLENALKRANGKLEFVDHMMVVLLFVHLPVI